MASETEKSYTRITLALDIIGKITQGPFVGFHELSIIKHQIDLYDIITIEDANKPEICCNHPSVPLDNTNICSKALEAVKKACGISKNARIIIEKNIPVLGGLAGGSANGASTLRLLNKLWNLGLSTNQLINIGRSTGMDVPFYFIGNTAFDTEATGVLNPIDTALTFDFVLAIPDFGVSTKEAYKNIDYGRSAQNTGKTATMHKAFIDNDRATVIATIHNDFEISVFKTFPDLQKLKNKLLDIGCASAVLSGSGSTIVGVLDSCADKEKIQAKLECKTLFVSTKI